MSENDVIDENEKIIVLDDGAVLRAGRVTEAKDEAAEPENEPLKLADVLGMPGSIAASPQIFSPAVQAILDSREESPEKAAARAARLEKIALLLAEAEEEK